MIATEQQCGRSRHRPNIAFEVESRAMAWGALKARSHIATGLKTLPASVFGVQDHSRIQPFAARETEKIDFVQPLFDNAFASRALVEGS